MRLVRQIEVGVANGKTSPAASHLVNQSRGTRRHQPVQHDNEDSLTRALCRTTAHQERRAGAHQRRAEPMKAKCRYKT